MSTPVSSIQGEPSQASSTPTMTLSSLASDSSSPSGTDLGFSQSQDGILTVPLEVLERILRYTFLRQTYLTPSSDPYPLRNTTHLLLVSRAFRELCLPFFFQSITIARPSDYITFFDPKDGIFVGEQGRRRWSFVKAIGFGWKAEPPSVFPRGDNSSWIVPLLPPEGRGPKLVTFFDSGDVKNAPFRDLERALEDSLRDAETRERARGRLKLAFTQSPYYWNGGRNLDEWSQSTFGRTPEEEVLRNVEWDARHAIWEARGSFYNKLLSPPHDQPPCPFLLQLPDAAHHLQHTLNIASKMVPSPIVSLSFHRSPQTPSNDPLASALFSRLLRLTRILFFRLTGYSTKEIPPMFDQLFEGGQEGEWCFVFDPNENLEFCIVGEKAFSIREAAGTTRYRRVPKSMELELRRKSPVVQAEEGS
ncbi:hypothetical protein BDY24DRAFT_442887 [Mrakia frigida]|uniref:uncharacterized protein n=1 Tax=Mrakia frigida TaxID=29902 RepID=UPI003FCBF57C